MKTTRKILALLMALTLCLAIAAPAFADSDYIITIDNAVKGETYTAYKIFDVTYANANGEYAAPSPATDIPGEADGTHAYTAYAYTIMDNGEWWEVVTGDEAPDKIGLGTSFTANGLKFTKTANANEWIVEATNSFEAATFAALLRDHMPNPAPAYAAQVTASDANMTGTTAHDTYYTTGAIRLDVGSAGYYFVDTTTGALCSLDTTEPTATIRDKNSLPTQEKTVSDKAEGPYGKDTSASFGDTVYFKIDVTDGIGTDAALTVHDIMSNGLTLDPTSFTIEANTGDEGASETVASTNYTIKTKDTSDSYDAPGDAACTFEIEFNADYIAGLADGKVITIKYTATVDDDAVIAGEGNPNTSKVEYSNQMTPESKAVVYTYAGAIYKFDGATGAELAGATFAVTAPPLEHDIEGIEPPEEAVHVTPVPDDYSPDDGQSIGGNVAKRGVLNGATSQPVPLSQVSPGSATAPAVYKYDPDGSSNLIVTPESGAVVLLGFAEGTVLTLTETVAPTGYNLLAASVTLTIKATHDDTVDKSYTIGTAPDTVTVTFEATDYDNDHNVTASGDDYEKQIHADSIVFIQNNTGTELPSTGGIGTTIFIIAGSILVLGAGIVLVAMSVSKRRSEEN